MRHLIFIITLTLTLAIAAAPSIAEPDAKQPGTIPPGYSVETIVIPDGVQFGVAGLDVAPNGDVYAATRFGDIWRYHAAAWSLVADGLHEPTGLLVELVAPGSVNLLVAQKPELTRLRDTDGDGLFETYDTVTADFGFSGNYHEFHFGPVLDSKGNLYCTLNLSHGGGKSVKGSGMSVAAPFRGTCFKVSSSGEFSVFAWGMRSPAGIGIDPRNDDIFYTDNQGDWNGSSTLQHVVEGRFHGHPASLMYNPEFKGKKLNDISDADYEKLRTPPAVWIPHGELANSPGNPIVDMTGGKFGPFAGQLFIGDQTRSNIFRVALDKVGGEYQGAAIEMINHLQCGAIRIAFAPDGSMWVSQTSRGWGSAGGKPFGVQRIVYHADSPPFEIHSVKLTPDGFDIRFTRPVDKTSAANLDGYHVKHWHYHYKSQYGSPKYDETFVKPDSATVSSDGLTVHLKLPELKTGKVYSLTMTEIKAADAASLTNKTAYYTLNRLRE